MDARDTWMNNFSRLLLVAVFLPAFFGCSAQDRDMAPLPDFGRLVLEEYTEPYKSGDIERWLEAFAEDAVGMHNTLPALEGKQALRRFAQTVHDTFNIEQMDVTVDTVTRSGDWVLTRGNFTAHFVLKEDKPEAQSQPRQGKYILLWERQEDGAWKIILDMGNNNSP